MTEVLPDASAPAVLDALDLHERGVSATFARALGGTVVDRPDILVYVTGLPAEFANGAKAPRLDESSADPAIELSKRMLEEGGVAGTWSVGPLATPTDLDRRLEAAGFPQRHSLPILAAAIERMALDASDPPELEIRRVDGDEAHLGWIRVMELGFDMAEGHTVTIDRTAAAMGFDPEGPWVRFIGTWAGNPVASSGLMLFGGIAGIYNVATLPEARRKGFGGAMTRAAVRYGRDRGYRVAMLGTSDLGRGVYERMGFRDVCVYRQFVYEPRS